MSHRSFRSTGLVLFAASLLSLGAFAQGSLDVMFEQMDPHIGQALFLRIVEVSSREEIARVVVPEITSGAFELELDGLETGKLYRIDLFADVNGNGRYDAPPVDHAWRIDLPEISADQVITFVHTAVFTDIGWPPAIDGTIEALEYAETVFDSQTGMSVSSRAVGDVLYIGLRAPGTGWLSIGFEPELRMQGANIIIAGIENGVLTIEDHYGHSQTAHRLDATSDIIQAAGIETASESVLEFAIPLDSGDDEDQALTAGSEITIILAYHSSDDRLTVRHSKRSTMQLVLYE